MMELSLFWHRRILHHSMAWRRVTVPMWDLSAKGWFVDCQCGKDWAL